MRKFTSAFALSACIALVGCAAPAIVPPPAKGSAPQASAAFGPGDLPLQIRLAGPRGLQEVIEPYDYYDISRVEVIPLVKEGDDYHPFTATGALTTEGTPDQLRLVFEDEDFGLHRSYVLKNLAFNRQYRVLIRAYKDDEKISVDDESYADILFSDESWENPTTVPLRLMDKVFSTSATVNVEFEGDEAVIAQAAYVKLFFMRQKGGKTTIFGGGGAHELTIKQFSRSVSLNALGPDATYTFRVEVLDHREDLLAVGRVVFETTTETDPQEKSLVLDFGWDVSTVENISPGMIDFVRDDHRYYMVNADTKKVYSYDADWGEETIAENLNDPKQVILDKNGLIVIVDAGAHCIYKYQKSGELKASIGSFQGYEDGSAHVRFDTPIAVTVDDKNHLYVLEANGTRIRKIDEYNNVTTVYQDASEFDSPEGICYWDGALYVADTGNHQIKKVPLDGGNVETVAGSTPGHHDDWRNQAKFKSPRNIEVAEDGTFYVTDEHRVLKINPEGYVKTIAGSDSADTVDGKGSTARFNDPRRVQLIPDGPIFVLDYANNSIRKIAPPGTK